MKKIALLLSLAIAGVNAHAQYSIHGHGYTTTFDSIGTALPSGWSVYSGASATSLGTIATFENLAGVPSVLRPDTASCIALVNVGGFKNFASATVCHQNDDWCATPPPTYTN